MNCISEPCINNDEPTNCTNNAVQQAIAQIRCIRKLDITTVTTDHIDMVMELMTTHPETIKVQQSGCQTIANLSMNEDVRAYVVHNNTHFVVLEALQKYAYDWKLAWLACSALWNITLSPSGRQHFPVEAIGLLLDLLPIHLERSRVVKVVIGCLSNLALTNQFRGLIGHPDHLQVYFKILLSYAEDTQVSSTGAGLVANLGVSDEVANSMVDLNVIPILKEMLQYKQKNDATFQRNVVAAFRNCRTGHHFVRDCILYEIVEELFYLMDHAVIEDIISLPITMICNALNASIAHRPSSFHLACYHGCVYSFKHLLLEKQKRDAFFDFNLGDKFNHTLLSYAIEGGSREMVSFLVLCGGTKYSQSDKALPPSILSSMITAQEQKVAIEHEYHQCIYQASSAIPFSRDVVDTIMAFVQPYDLTRQYFVHSLQKMECSDQASNVNTDDLFSDVLMF